MVAGALYQHGMYYRRIMEPGFPSKREQAGDAVSGA